MSGRTVAMKRCSIFCLCLACLALSGCLSLGPAPKYGEDVMRCYGLTRLSAAEVEVALGPPERMLNVEGMGYYGYRDYGIFFDDIVFVYGPKGKQKIEGNRARAVAVDYLGPQGLQGLRRGQSAAEVETVLGKPDRRLNIPPGGDIFDPFAGSYAMYRLEDGWFALRLDGDKLQSILVVGANCTVFK